MGRNPVGSDKRMWKGGGEVWNLYDCMRVRVEVVGESTVS